MKKQNDLHARVARLDEDIIACKDILSELIDQNATREELDKAVADVKRCENLRDAVLLRIEASKGAKQKENEQLKAQAKRDAANRATELLAVVEKSSADVDSFCNGLVNSIMHLEMVWDSLRNDLYDAGIDHSSMRQLTDWRCIDALLADRLSRSTIASRLNFVSVNGVQHLDQGVCMTDMVKIRNKKLASLLTKVAQ